MERTRKARTILGNYIQYCKGKGWKVDSLEVVFSEFSRLDERNKHMESLLYKACLFLAKLDRHPSHLYWVKHLDAETLERELGKDFDLEYFKQRYSEWKQ